MSNTKRRKPTQDRASKRIKSMLEAAAQLIVQVGYDSVTMTAIAARAQTSVGSLYQYFPDKEAVMQALFALYGDKIEDRWAPLMDEMPRLSPAQTASQLVDFLVDFIDSHPAYLPLREAPLKLTRAAAARDRLRHRIADAFGAQQPSLTKQEAWLIGNVAIQILKGVSALYAKGTPQERAGAVREVKFALSAYLTARLAVSASAQ